MQNNLQFYSTPIDLTSLPKNSVSRVELDSKTTVAIAWDGNKLSVFRDYCPHMGAPMSDGKLCRKTNSLICPWHGYFFDLETGKFTHNPNDEIFESMKKSYKTFNPQKTPAYKLQRFEFKIIDSKAFILRKDPK